MFSVDEETGTSVFIDRGELGIRMVLFAQVADRSYLEVSSSSE